MPLQTLQVDGDELDAVKWGLRQYRKGDGVYSQELLIEVLTSLSETLGKGTTIEGALRFIASIRT